ncbi:MAG: AAA family ATPase [Deltaproteobacteria bacterium]|nr:MAG: AAA family ATPase [Deltaproteobacteria bacterium]
MTAKNILVTGPPRSGKSTLIEKVVRRIDKPVTGFFTRELKERGRRVGFSITTMDGRTGILAHYRTRSKFRVGRYGVSLQDLDQIAVPSMRPSRADEIVVIDEIGKMECFSFLFRETLIASLSSQHQVIGSIAIKGNTFIERIKKREDVLLIPISETTREAALDLFLEAVRRYD